MLQETTAEKKQVLDIIIFNHSKEKLFFFQIKN